MTALSAKARAFSVDYLLGKDDSGTDREKERKTPQQEDNLCSAMGDGPVCCHSSVNSFTGL